MSDQLSFLQDGPNRPGSGAGKQGNRASLAREMRYLLTISTDTGRPGCIRPAGVAHSMGVCLIEDSNMARGNGKGNGSAKSMAMPRFVDIKLTAEQRQEFIGWSKRGGDLVTFLQSLADDGYRVGVSWSGEQQAYTVSLTGREEGNPNNGLCMTSFAKTLETALWLAVYKHVEVSQERWVEASSGGEGDFG